MIRASFSTSLSEDAETYARGLILKGLTTDSESWNGPTTGQANRYLSEKGLEAYGRWFLGRNDDRDRESKEFYSYPMTSDFETVNRRGLIAIRTRAAQNDEETIFDAAGRLIEAYDYDTAERYANRNHRRICFQRRPRRRTAGRYEVNEKTGARSDVALSQTGAANGHGGWIDARSLETALDVLGDTLPAYVTHEGAVEADRILKEIGVFSEFYVEDGKLKAEQFKALSSFREDEPERFRRLFDLAREMPDAFGLSLVFEANLVWVLPSGDEIPVEEGTGEDALRDAPSVRFLSIRSADFVDAPAANESLFQKPSKKPQEATAMSEEKNKQEVIDLVDEMELKEKPTGEETSEEILEENPEATEALEATEDEASDRLAALESKIDELGAQLEENAKIIADLTTELSDTRTKNEKLSAAIKGEEVLAEGDEEIHTPGLLEKFENADPADKHNIWKQNKTEILQLARRA